MKIQLINYSGENDKKFDVETVNSFGSPMSLDSFDLNILDLTASEIWQNKLSNKNFQTLSIDKDFKTLLISIENSKKAKFLYLLPSNVTFKTSFDYLGFGDNGQDIYDFQTNTLLKDILPDFMHNLEKIIAYLSFEILYERTITLIGTSAVKADFYFDDVSDGERKIYSKDSNKLVSLTDERYTYTTLLIDTNEIFQTYINRVFDFPVEIVSVPDWFNDITFFDDAEQKELIEIEKQKIEESKKQIKTSREIINQNKYFESILYKSGDDLEIILIEMLREIFKVDSNFEDTKDEDFSFEKGGIHYIFEFKGISKDLKKQNISQLMTHVYKYADSYQVAESQIRRVIIATRYKDKSTENRLPISHNIIEFAKNSLNNVLIIDTVTFLRIFEKFRNDELSTEDIFTMLDKSGLLVIE